MQLSNSEIFLVLSLGKYILPGVGVLLVAIGKNCVCIQADGLGDLRITGNRIIVGEQLVKIYTVELFGQNRANTPGGKRILQCAVPFMQHFLGQGGEKSGSPWQNDFDWLNSNQFNTLALQFLRQMVISIDP